MYTFLTIRPLCVRFFFSFFIWMLRL